MRTLFKKSPVLLSILVASMTFFSTMTARSADFIAVDSTTTTYDLQECLRAAEKCARAAGFTSDFGVLSSSVYGATSGGTYTTMVYLWPQKNAVVFCVSGPSSQERLRLLEVLKANFQ